jgi:Tfp pilus assembly protein PilN
MIVPNLASRPLLNTRPVWLVVAVAAFLSLVFLVLNTRVWLTSSRALEEQILRLSQLEQDNERLISEVGQQAEDLNRVPWKSLAARVNAVNAVIKEHEFSWIGLLDDIERVLPYDVRLTKITPKVDGDTVILSLTAIGRTREALLDFFDNLIEDPSFSDPTPSSEITPEESGFGYVFQMTVVHHPGQVSP